jgi:hypothetical protein
MPQRLDTKYITHAAIVGYALSMALFEQLEGGAIKAPTAIAALKFLPAKPRPDAPPADLVMWLAAEAELKRLGAPRTTSASPPPSNA